MSDDKKTTDGEAMAMVADNRVRIVEGRIHLPPCRNFTTLDPQDMDPGRVHVIAQFVEDAYQAGRQSAVNEVASGLDQLVHKVRGRSW